MGVISKWIFEGFRKRAIFNFIGPLNFQLNFQFVLNATLMLSKLTLFFQRNRGAALFNIITYTCFKYTHKQPLKSSLSKLTAKNREEKSNGITFRS